VRAYGVFTLRLTLIDRADNPNSHVDIDDNALYGFSDGTLLLVSVRFWHKSGKIGS